MIALTNRKVLVLMFIGLFSFPLSSISAQEDLSWINIPIGNSALYVEIAGDAVYVTNPADGKIGDSDFVQGIQWLISNGIIKI